QAEDGIRDFHVTGVQTCALPISLQALAGHSFEMPLLSSSKVKPCTWRVEGVERLALGGASIDAVRVRRVLATGSDDPVIEAWFRSEERRGGKECRVGWAPMQHRG